MSSGRDLFTAAFLLHRRPYRETSLLLEAFTEREGRIALVARGVRRGRGAMQGLLEPFRPLLLAWRGRGEVATLTGAEADGRAAYLGGQAVISGFYLNELLLRLLPRHDPMPVLFDCYRATVARLAEAAGGAWALRLFERDLLQELGYGLELTGDADGAPVSAEGRYCYHPEHGFVAAGPGAGGVVVRGRVLLALASGAEPDGDGMTEAKRLMRVALQPHLGDKPLASRELFARSLRRRQ